MATIVDHTQGRDAIIFSTTDGIDSFSTSDWDARHPNWNSALYRAFYYVGRPVSENEIIGVKLRYSEISGGTGLRNSADPIKKKLEGCRKHYPNYTFTVSDTVRSVYKGQFDRHYRYEGTVTISAPVSALRQRFSLTAYELSQKRAAEVREQEKQMELVLKRAEPLTRKLEDSDLIRTLYTRLFYGYEREQYVKVTTKRAVASRSAYADCSSAVEFSELGVSLDSPFAPVAVAVALAKYVKKQQGLSFTLYPSYPSGDSCDVSFKKPEENKPQMPLRSI